MACGVEEETAGQVLAGEVDDLFEVEIVRPGVTGLGRIEVFEGIVLRGACKGLWRAHAVFEWCDTQGEVSAARAPSGGRLRSGMGLERLPESVAGD